MSTRVANGKLQAFDADAKPIHVGDRLEWQETSGPYGQTERGCGTVTHAEMLYGMIRTDGGCVETHWEMSPKDGPEGLYCRHENQSFDHAHRTWARIVSRDAVREVTP